MLTFELGGAGTAGIANAGSAGIEGGAGLTLEDWQVGTPAFWSLVLLILLVVLLVAIARSLL